MSSHKLAQSLWKLRGTLLLKVVGLVLAAFIWTYNDNSREVLRPTPKAVERMNPLVWDCEGCNSTFTFTPVGESARILEGDGRIVLECECGKQFVISKDKVVDYDKWFMKVQIKWFRYLLDHTDIITEVGGE